jgi:recombination protein U
MPTWNSRGLRGSALEELINMTNNKYKEKGMALVQKIPTPIKPVAIDEKTRHITLAYFEKKSTVDYLGVVQGIPICFDVKECKTNRFPLSNIHEHQIEFMESFEKQDGISFLIIHYTHLEKAYYISLKSLLEFYRRSLERGKKSFDISELEDDCLISSSREVPFHYLEALKKDLESRD